MASQTARWGVTRGEYAESVTWDPNRSRSSRPKFPAGDDLLQPVPVLALTVVNCEPLSDLPGSVLWAVRAPATNRTHPTVVSVPTGRIAAGIAESFGAELPIDGEFLWRSRLNADGHDAAIYAVEALLARKLGLSEPLESGCIR